MRWAFPCVLAVFSSTLAVACGSRTSLVGGEGTTGGSAGGGAGGGGGGAGVTAGGGGGLAGGGGGSAGGGGSGAAGAGGGGGPNCPDAPCTAGACCADLVTGGLVCSSSCPNLDKIECLGPADCGPSGPDCCGSVQHYGGNYPACQVPLFGTSCDGICTTDLVFSCNSNDTLHICTQPSDCSAIEPHCCLADGFFTCMSDLDMQTGGFTNCR